MRTRQKDPHHLANNANNNNIEQLTGLFSKHHFLPPLF